MNKLIYIFSLLNCVWNVIYCKDYCSIDRKHMLCNHNMDEERECPSDAQFIEIGDVNQKEIVKALNLVRSKVANGDDIRGHGKYFHASNMLQMEWDEELATASRSIVKKCGSYTPCPQCDVLERFPVAFIQHMFNFSMHDKPLPLKLYLEFVLRQDFDKVEPNSVDSFQSNLILPYDKIIWAETYLVGCSIALFKKNGDHIHNVVCVLGPSEPKHKKPMYHVGAACSECPSGSTCSKEYKGLCKCNDNCHPAKYLSEDTPNLSHRQRRQATTITATTVAGGNKDGTTQANADGVTSQAQTAPHTTHHAEMTTHTPTHAAATGNDTNPADDSGGIVLLTSLPMTIGAFIIASVLLH